VEHIQENKLNLNLFQLLCQMYIKCVEYVMLHAVKFVYGPQMQFNLSVLILEEDKIVLNVLANVLKLLTSERHS
jgi:hypothetical protein